LLIRSLSLFATLSDERLRSGNNCRLVPDSEPRPAPHSTVLPPS